VLALALGITLMVTFFCGVAPALQAIRGELPSRIASSGRMGEVFRHGKFRAALVIGEVAISLVLLTGAGLMARSFLALRQVDLGFDPEQVGFAEVFPAKSVSHKLDQQKLFFRQVLERVHAIPGITSAAETSSIPALVGGGHVEIDVPGITHSEQWGALMEFCSEDYFQTLGLQLQKGRMLTRSDVDSSAQVAVINRTLATKYFGHTDPVGKKLKFIGFDQIPDEPHSPFFEIIGVVSDFKNRELRLPSEPQAFVPYTISAIGNRAILVRSVVKPESLAPDIRRAIWAVDSNVAVGESGSVEHWLNRTSFGAPHFGSIFLGSFAAVGLALAGIGVFSVMAYTVSMQTHEVGIRMALGAQRGNILFMVLFKGLRLIAAGVVTGLGASYLLTSFLASQLWGVSRNDPRIYGAVIVIMIAAGAAACLLPARKATQVDPIIAIRCE
jgi:putative ABC transport system permease protein